MSATFPTTSSVATQLDHLGYDSAALMKLVKAAGKQKSQVGKAKGKKGKTTTTVSTPARPPGVHLHTLTIQVELETPESHFLYHQRDPEPNPAYEAYDRLRQSITSSEDAYVPIELIPPAQHVARTHLAPRGRTIDPGPAVGVYSSARADSEHGQEIPLLSLGQKRRYGRGSNGALQIQGATEWFSNTSAWDTSNWLHAVLALDPDQAPTRKGVYRDQTKRFQLETSLHVFWEPERDVGEGEEMDPTLAILKATITVNVYADLANIAIPAPEVATELIGLILHSLIPPDTAALVSAQSASKARTVALQHFFECMQPAPFLPRGMTSASLQPKAMVSQLLPFQLRTLRFLLEREHAIGYAAESNPVWDPAGFWSNLPLGEGRRAYRRVTGDVAELEIPKSSGQSSGKGGRKGKGRAMDVDIELEEDHDGLSTRDKEALPGLLDMSKVRGTMLCEEMGLGKTVEAIALMLHHRHPLSTSRDSLDNIPTTAGSSNTRSENPNAIAARMATTDPGRRVKRKQAQESVENIVVPTIDLLEGPPGLEEKEISKWLQAELKAFKDTSRFSEESKVDVTEVATTLIVTPPSLLKQWVSEIRTHAPGIRVCVYTGWKGLQEGLLRLQKHQNRVASSRSTISEADRKRKAVEAMRRKTVNKYSKGVSGTRIKQEEDSDTIVIDEDDDEEEEEEVEDRKSLLDVTQTEFEKYVRAHDVVITTYQDLAQDLAVAHPAPPRSRRKNVNYKHNERPRSPLIMVEWWRVIMDEVQLSSDQSSASEMVSLIPRRNSLAVSGTPVKTDIKDLLGVLRFLRVPVLPYEPKLWYRLQQPSFRSAFEGIFRSISVRTTKQQVQDELVIPRQSRFVIPIELSQIEQHYYLDTLGRQRDIIHRRGGGGLDRAILRACLLDLRQICTHIQVGMMQAAAGAGQRGEQRKQRMHLGSELMTMAEALKKMKDEHTMEFMVESRQQLRLMVQLGQLIMEDKERRDRLDAAARSYERCRVEVEKQLPPVRQELHRLLNEAGRKEDDDLESNSTPERKMSQQDKERHGNITSIRTAIRELLIILHQAWFLMGDVRHQEGNEEQENQAYGKADDIRKEILATPLRQSVLAIERLDAVQKEGHVKDVKDLQTMDTKRRGGLASATAIASANELMSLMNENALLVWEWRTKIIQLLRKPVEANADDIPVPIEVEEKAEVDFYATSIQAQGEAQMYLTAYAAALMDRKEMMVEQRNYLVEVDAQRVVERTTARAKKAKEAGEELGLFEADSLKALLEELMQERQAFVNARKDSCERPLKAYLIDLNSIIYNASARQEEVAICKDMTAMIKQYIKQQTERFDELNKELDLLRGVFNHRVRYFAALQEISDSVSAPDQWVDEFGPRIGRKQVRERNNAAASIATKIERCNLEIQNKELKLASLSVRGRYLETLSANTDRNEEELREDCIICMGSSEDTHGMLLDCGHFFCASCFKAYRSSANRGCPSCRQEIDERAITRFKLGGSTNKAAQVNLQGLVSADLAATTALDSATASSSAAARTGEDEEETGEGGMTLDEMEEQEYGRTRAEEAEKQRRNEDLKRISMMDLQMRREIAHMDMMGEYGSKIDFLIKHLLWYRARQPGVRHVIFSNWSDSLSIVTQALKANGVKFASFEGNKTKDVVDNFIKDPTITVFLLHAERESAGLTLTTCQVVHLLEPVLRHSFELQAIGRVDRLGQKKETTVYCYATKDTVESRILSLGVRNGTSIYLKPDDVGRQEVERMPNVVGAAGKGGDLGGGDGNEEELLGLIL